MQTADTYTDRHIDRLFHCNRYHGEDRLLWNFLWQWFLPAHRQVLRWSSIGRRKAKEVAIDIQTWSQLSAVPHAPSGIICVQITINCDYAKTINGRATYSIADDSKFDHCKCFNVWRCAYKENIWGSWLLFEIGRFSKAIIFFYWTTHPCCNCCQVIYN